MMRRDGDLAAVLPTRRRKTGVRWAASIILAVVFCAGYLLGEKYARPPRAVYECSGQRLVGTLFTDDEALAVPGDLVLAWDAQGKKKLVSRTLFELCATVAPDGA